VTSYTCRCPRFASVTLAPLTALLLVIDVITWGQEAWISSQYYGFKSAWLAIAFALVPVAALMCTAIRQPPEPMSRWRRLLRVEERTLIAAVPIFLLAVWAAAAAVI
jgi:hypothetical protein